MYDEEDNAPLPSTQDLLGGGGGGAPSAKFPSVGTSVGGPIVRPARVSQQTDMQGNKKFWPDGNRMVQIEATVQTTDRDPSIDNDDGQRRIFIKGQMMTALRDALAEAGVSDLAPGGNLVVSYTSDKPAAQRGFNPAKQYTVKYQPPTREWSNDEEPF